MESIPFDIEIDTLHSIKADNFQIKQVFKNLINNGIKYQKEGEKPLIKVKSKETGNQILFSVQDNGIGISKEYQNRIFEIFKRLHSSEQYEGTGIGLSICKRITERLGGDIWVESDGQNGSTFYFSIPK